MGIVVGIHLFLPGLKRPSTQVIIIIDERLCALEVEADGEGDITILVVAEMCHYVTGLLLVVRYFADAMNSFEICR